MAALVCGFFLAACTDLTGPGETIPPGMGQVHIRLDQPNIRTVIPPLASLEDVYFTLGFTAEGKDPVDTSLDSKNGLSLTVALESAVWTLVVTGYKGHTDNDLGRPIVQGTSTVPVTAGMFSNVAVALVPVFDSGVTGTLSYSIKFPETVSQAFLSLQGTSHKIDMLEIDDETEETTAKGIAEGTEDLPAGAYQVFIDLYDGTTNKAAVWTGVVHIYDDSITKLDQTFDIANFAGPQVVGKDEPTLAGKLAAALAFPRGACTIILDGEEELIAFAPQTLSVTAGQAIAITIEGNGKTVQVTETGTPLFTLDTGLTLVIQDLTLKGMESNSAPVVQVKDGATLDLQDDSIIKGNTSNTSGGGVVVDSGGTLSMSGGEISGNTVSGNNNGGGVYINGGTFTMTGGAIRGNSTPGSGTGAKYGGGGVYVTGGGTFTMSGGEVRGNSSYTDGGGVFVYGATFEMSGGEISGNSAKYGGGLYVSSATFTMTGGVVYGSESVNSSKKNTAPNGAAISTAGTNIVEPAKFDARSNNTLKL